jgi:hypothetical protein
MLFWMWKLRVRAPLKNQKSTPEMKTKSNQLWQLGRKRFALVILTHTYESGVGRKLGITLRSSRITVNVCKNPKLVSASTSKFRRIIMRLMQPVTGISVNNTELTVNHAILKLYKARTLYNKAEFLFFATFTVKIFKIWSCDDTVSAYSSSKYFQKISYFCT